MKRTTLRKLQAAMVIATLVGGFSLANAATETPQTGNAVITDAQAQQHFQTMNVLRQKVFDTQQALDNEYNQAKPDQAKIAALTQQLGQLNAQWYASRSEWHRQMMDAGYARGPRAGNDGDRGYGWVMAWATACVTVVAGVMVCVAGKRQAYILCVFWRRHTHQPPLYSAVTGSSG